MNIEVYVNQKPEMSRAKKVLISLMLLVAAAAFVFLILLIVSSALTLVGLFLIGLAILLPILFVFSLLRAAIQSRSR